MTRFLVALAVALPAAASAAIGPLADGRYEGTGYCRGGKVPRFETTTVMVISGNEMLETSTMPGFPSFTMKKTFVMAADGSFTFTADPAEDGEGYCGQTGCHWEAVFEDKKGEDTLTVAGDSIRLLGSAVVKGQRVFCEKVLQRKTGP